LLAVVLTGCAVVPGLQGGKPVPGSDPAPGSAGAPGGADTAPRGGAANGDPVATEGPAPPSERPAEQTEPADGQPPGPLAEEAAGEVTMLDCLRRFGLAELSAAVEELLQGLPSDELWQCVARTARFDRGYRASVAYDLLLTGLDGIDTSLPGYQAFARTTELRFGEPHTVPAPAGWVLLDATPSSSGRYVAARLADGGVGWWAVDGSRHERYDTVGYDLVWHPAEDQLAFISDGNRLHLVRPEGPLVHQVFQAPVGGIRFPYWALREWWATGVDHAYPPGTVLALADPEGAPEGLALRPDSGRWERFTAKRILAPGREVIFPDWLTQPWSVWTGDYLHVDPDGGWVAYPNAGGSSYLFYQVQPEAEPVSLTWSPEARFFAVVERRDGQLAAQVLRGSHDYTGTRFTVPLENTQFAVWDDGVNTFSAQGRTVRAQNHLTGAAHTWQVEGEVRSIRLGRDALFIVLDDRLVVVPITG